MDDLLTEFLTETNESLATLDVEIVRLEQNPNDPELLGNIFRLVHTIKGTCGFLGLPRLEAVAHASENVLGKFRDGEMEVSPQAVTLILAALDRIKELLGALEATEQEPEGTDDELIAQLNALAQGKLAADALATCAPQAAPVSAEPAPDAGVGATDTDTDPQDSLFDRLGGVIGIEGAVDFTMAALQEDAAIATALAAVDPDVYAGVFKAYLTKIVGGPDHTTGELPGLQAQVVAAGFDAAAFDKLTGLVKTNLEAIGAPADDAQEAADMLEMAREDLLATAPDQEPAIAAPTDEPAVDQVVTEPPPAEPAPAAVDDAPQPAAEATVPAPAAPSGEAAAARESSVAAQTIRVNVDVLENLMTMVSELVLTRNQLLQILRSQQESDFAAPLQRLSHVTTELQEGVMKTRMQPIGNAWSKLPRIIRDLSMELDKKIDLQMVGAETELDRQVLELIRDPLTHMVRNSADHGLEGTAERLAAGKPETGTVKLRAFHEGGHIIIEIADDGRGLNVERIAQKALENGLVTEAALEDMSDQQIGQFIFKPGFSTASQVTAVSGRGVGMDVVRSNIEKIGGTVDLSSKPGKGSTFTIKIPLTLAIVSALIVEAGGERFAVPQLSVVELVRASRNSEHAIEWIRETPVLRLRDRLLPLVSLNGLLELGDPATATDIEAERRTNGSATNGAGADDAVADGAATNGAQSTGHDPEPDELEVLARLAAAHPEKSHEGLLAMLSAGGTVEDADQAPAPVEGDGGAEEHFIIVTQVGSYSFGIIVDRVFDTEEIVVKPVAPILRNVSMFSGNTILGDGSVIMILDPNGIAAATGELTVADAADADGRDKHAADGVERVSLLVFRAGSDTPKAVPLALVARLEEIDLSTVEHSSGTPMVQYRGRLMPLVPMSAAGPLSREGNRPVLVFTDQERSMGLVVDQIVDIVEDRLNVEIGGEEPGVMGSAIVASRATDVIDAGYFLEQAFDDWFCAGELSAGKEQSANRVLLVDDSPFFRNLLTPLLSVAGYRVTAVDGAEAALKLCEDGASFDAIVSDIEMPEMDGFEFARAVKETDSWCDIPLVALSSHTTPEDLDRGREVGFTDYVAKSDRDALLMSLSQIMTAGVRPEADAAQHVMLGTA